MQPPYPGQYGPDEDLDRAVQAVTVPAAAGAKLAASGRYFLHGWSLVNAGTVAGTVTIYDGQDTNGQPVVTIPIPASSAATLWLGNPGIALRIGCVVNQAGAFTPGQVFLRPASHIGYGNRPKR